MENKTIIIMMLGIFLISFASSVGEVSYCCEKTIEGAWCQNSPQENCETGNNCEGEKCRSVPSSCEATSYCKLGTCISEGNCMENTPERKCDKDLGGHWEAKDVDEIPQCALGCCLIGDQAAFVTQTGCKTLSALYGLETNFRTDLTSEISCIASAMSDVKGACVYEEEYVKTCQFLSKKECSDLGVGNGTEFHQGFLCSAESLSTNCGKGKQTTCVEGRDEVYFLDTCGNLANIYDASKINDKDYWTNIYGKEESCVLQDNLGNAKKCGSCDYYAGSTCKDYKTAGKKADYGNNICQDLNCDYEGKIYQHGETWCADSNGIDTSLPGSRHFRLVCYNGEVSVEPCADFRQEVCLQSDIEGFRTAACRVNMWQDCSAQTTAKDCGNIDRRDCKWIGKCVPLYAPGFNFWETGDATSLCATASTTCVVKYEKKLGGSKKCVENCECLATSWEAGLNQKCIAVGDCGSKTNYLGFKGY